MYIQKSMLLDIKIKKSLERLKSFEPKEGYWLGFSGGKDSIVIKKLAEMANVKFESHYNHTTVDPPELIYFIREYHQDVIIDYPIMSMWDLIVKKLIPPTRLVRYCCSELKERGGKNRFVVTGVRWSESSKRKNRRTAIENFHSNPKYQFYTNDNYEGRMMIENCIKKGKFILNPIIDWSDSEVWEFIKLTKIKYCELYDCGYKRLGCIGCPMAYWKQREKEFFRYPKYKEKYIKTFDKMIKNRIKKYKETSWNSGEEVFDWWIYGDKYISKKEIKS